MQKWKVGMIWGGQGNKGDIGEVAETEGRDLIENGNMWLDQINYFLKRIWRNGFEKSCLYIGILLVWAFVILANDMHNTHVVFNMPNEIYLKMSGNLLSHTSLKKKKRKEIPVYFGVLQTS